MRFAREDIVRYLPHRPPFLLLDEVLAFEPLVSATGLLRLTGTEPFFAGHFPARPVMPGVLIIEHMAQLSAFLMARSRETSSDSPKTTRPVAERLMVLGSVDKARFRQLVEPPAELTSAVRVIKLLGDAGLMEAHTVCGETTVAEARFKFSTVGS